MNSWIKLNDNEYDHVWNKFDNKFKFHPSVNKRDWPGILEPTPSVTFDISDYYNKSVEEATFMDNNLMDVFLNLFKSLTNEDEWIYALDWQHESYMFYPHQEFQLNEFNEWPVPILPNGDYYIFLKNNFKYGVFGHPWEQTMCVFGIELIKKIEENPPKLFNKIVREKRITRELT